MLNLDNNFEAPPSVNEEDKRRKKKRNGPSYLGGSRVEANDAVSFARHPFAPPAKPLPNHLALRDRYSDDLLDDCPILNAIDKRCHSVDLISGSGTSNVYAEALLPACGVHQFCYLCVSTPWPLSLSVPFRIVFFSL